MPDESCIDNHYLEAGQRAGLEYECSDVVSSSSEALISSSEEVSSSSEISTLDNGLMVFWQFNGDFLDASGNWSAGTMNGPYYSNDRNGAENSALYFDGIDDYAEGDPGFIFLDSNIFSYSFWVKPTKTRSNTNESTSGISGASGQSYALCPPSREPGNVGIGVSVGTNGVSVFAHGTGVLFSPLVYDVNITEWTHIAVNIQDKTPVLWINGTYKKTGQKISETVWPTSMVGDSKYDSYGPFKGGIDDIRIYNRALTEPEITELHNEVK